MGYGTYETTHAKIIESGKRLFLENGYERTNLRELCKEAGITTGSFYRHFESKEDLFSFLVKPVIDGVSEMYQSSEVVSADYVQGERIEEFWQFSAETANAFVTFIYQNFDSFKLLLQCADGTPYSNFVTDMTDREVQSSLRVFASMREHGAAIKELSEQELHMLSHAYISCVLECVMHDFTEKETLSHTNTIIDFFNAGWKKVLGL